MLKNSTFADWKHALKMKPINSYNIAATYTVMNSWLLLCNQDPGQGFYVTWEY